MSVTTSPATGARVGTARQTHETKAARVRAAAEVVFARKGFDGATMREVADAAGVGVSLVVYHFATKEGLYRAVFESRQYVNEDRLARLAGVSDAAAPDALEKLVSAFIDPVLDLHENEQDVSFARLVLREAADPSSQGRTIISELFDPMARAFIAKLDEILPGRPAHVHSWAYLFAVGALTQSAFDTRIENIGTCRSTAAEKRDCLRRFITAALRFGCRDEDSPGS
ncbi:TetR/AcrR family transcriptional regulator [Pseudonocardia alni]|uniref:TetR/AcrR family transcriptional regulator n=1 Tax=Pseudonocardia alni TaxID=33907 RepID=UPI0033C2DEA7